MLIVMVKGLNTFDCILMQRKQFPAEWEGIGSIIGTSVETWEATKGN